MIRYALLAVAAVVVYLWYTARTRVATRTVATVAPSPWAALGQALGGFFGARAAATPVRPSADAVYSRLGNPSPSSITAATNYSPSGLMPAPSPVYRSEYGIGGTYTEYSGVKNPATGDLSMYADVKDSEIMFKSDPEDGD